jgi:hypothetical protein
MESDLGAPFAVVHGGKGGGVDYGVNPGALDCSSHKAEISDVDFGQVRANHSVVGAEKGRKVEAQHSIASGNQDSHEALRRRQKCSPGVILSEAKDLCSSTLADEIKKLLRRSFASLRMTVQVPG